MLTDEQKRLREGKVGASFVPWLMAGDEKKIGREWQRLVGHPDYVEEDFSGEWIVQFGNYIEPFALDWHERKTGHPLTLRGEWAQHSEYPWLGTTLDAWREYDSTVIDCKARIGFQPIDEVRAFYAAQLVVQRACLGADRAALLIVHGGAEPREFEAAWDAGYEAQVWERLHWFWGRVESLQPPCALPMVRGPVPAVRTVDMTGRNEWAAYAANWLNTKEAADCFNRAAKSLKELVEPDVQKAFGHGICASRSRAGAISIKQI
jgi:hypothetical protein